MISSDDYGIVGISFINYSIIDGSRLMASYQGVFSHFLKAQQGLRVARCSQANMSKRRFPSDIFQAKIAKRKLPSECFQMPAIKSKFPRKTRHAKQNYNEHGGRFLNS